jgi:uncharacterized membrane protein
MNALRELANKLLSIFLAALGALLFSFSGFFSVFLGMYIPRFEFDALGKFILGGFFIFTGLGFLVFKRVFKVSDKGLWPLGLFLSTCITSGAIYDVVKLDDGIKLLTLFLVLLGVALCSVRMITPDRE